MEENKILVILQLPEIDEKYDLYIPVNKKIGNIIELFKKMIDEVTDNNYELPETASLHNRETGMVYNNNELVLDTDIRNGTTLVLI